MPSGLGTAGASIAAALVVAAAFAYRPVDGLLGFGIAILFADTVEYWTGGNIRYVDEAAVVLFVLVAFTVHRGRMRIPTPGWREGALAVFFLAGVISSLIQAVPANVWIPGFALLAKTFVFFYLVTSLTVTSTRSDGSARGAHRRARRECRRHRGVPRARLRCRASWASFRTRGAAERSEIVNSWFTTPALYGWIAPFLSLFLFARFAVLRERWALVLAFVLGGAGLLSGRRTPLVSMVVSLAVGAVRAMRSRRISWRPVAAIGAGAVLGRGPQRVELRRLLRHDVRDLRWPSSPDHGGLRREAQALAGRCPPSTNGPVRRVDGHRPRQVSARRRHRTLSAAT